MAIFKDKIVELNVSETYIGQDVLVKGDISLKGSIRIDGSLTGNISNAQSVNVGKSSKINGNISCEKCDIYGQVDGSIYAISQANLHEGCLLNGDLKSASISIENGAKFNGKCIMENYKDSNSEVK